MREQKLFGKSPSTMTFQMPVTPRSRFGEQNRRGTSVLLYATPAYSLRAEQGASIILLDHGLDSLIIPFGRAYGISFSTSATTDVADWP